MQRSIVHWPALPYLNKVPTGIKSSAGNEWDANFKRHNSRNQPVNLSFMYLPAQQKRFYF